MFFSSIKEVNMLISKRMSIMDFKRTLKEKLMLPKLLFYSFKSSVSRLVFYEPQFTQISLNFKTSCYNIKIRGLEAKVKGIMMF